MVHRPREIIVRVDMRLQVQWFAAATGGGCCFAGLPRQQRKRSFGKTMKARHLIAKTPGIITKTKVPAVKGKVKAKIAKVDLRKCESPRGYESWETIYGGDRPRHPYVASQLPAVPGPRPNRRKARPEVLGPSRARPARRDALPARVGSQRVTEVSIESVRYPKL
jgi:hypothetical protein